MRWWKSSASPPREVIPSDSESLSANEDVMASPSSYAVSAADEGSVASPTATGRELVERSRSRRLSSPPAPASNTTSPSPPIPIPTVLVIGGPQVGKSSFINAFRAVGTRGAKWPSAPVGVSGFYGTTSVEPYPDRSPGPRLLLIDTPGLIFDSPQPQLLEKVVRGIPWKTKLIGSGSVSLLDLDSIPCIASNAADQCVIVIPATELIHDAGWSNLIRLRPRHVVQSSAGEAILHLKSLVSRLRNLLPEHTPFVVVTRMDEVGGCACAPAVASLMPLLRQVISENRIFFVDLHTSHSEVDEATPSLSVQASRRALLRLHDEARMGHEWAKQVKDW